VTAATHRTKGRIAASIAVVGAAAAVAGLGTFGSFTDSTTPVVTQLETGVLSIELTKAADAATLSLFDNGNFLAGDSESSAIDLVNAGTVALGEMRMASVATSSSALDSDEVNGLQLAVDSCSESWTLDDGSWSCDGETTRFYSGPIVADAPLTGAASLAPGVVDHLLLTATLPATTTADMVADATSDLDFTFSTTQRGGTAR
jgi:predicted ribosomally synthesized peptide with SipW-like signal peptide